MSERGEVPAKEEVIIYASRNTLVDGAAVDKISLFHGLYLFDYVIFITLHVYVD